MLNSHDRLGLSPRAAMPSCTPEPSFSHTLMPGTLANTCRAWFWARSASSAEGVITVAFFPAMITAPTVSLMARTPLR